MLSWTNNLQRYIDNQLNVLLCGAGGVGKTAVIKDLFNKNFGDDWLYIAGATCDPFTDLIGVPRPTKDEETGKEVLDFVKPRKLQFNKVKAIFCDEYNRAPKKVMNALMEIIQFKSIGNEPVPNLQMVWCAVNPDDEDYNIEEKLDRSQKDRFHIWIDVPYVIDKEYFIKNFGQDITESSIEWWNELPDQVKKTISPRRVEYALKVHNIQGDLREVLPASANISKLVDSLSNGSIKSQIERAFKATDSEIKEMFIKNTNLMPSIKEKLEDVKFIKRFAHLLPEEIITEKAPSNLDLSAHIKQNLNQFEPSLISTLEQMGCFSSSKFATTFAMMNKKFADNYKYTARDRNKIKKVLSLLPDMSNTILTKKDCINLQKLINITHDYCSRSNYGTIERDNQNSQFLHKFEIMRDINNINNLGLDFKETNFRFYRSLPYFIERDKTAREEKLKREQQAQNTSAVAMPSNNSAVVMPNNTVVSQNYTGI